MKILILDDGKKLSLNDCGKVVCYVHLGNKIGVEGKIPENKWDKVINGKMNKWFNEVCLLNQQCVWDNKKTIKSICEEIDNVVIKEFVRFECGEGSKKEETKSFADEVAATISELYYDKQYKL